MNDNHFVKEVTTNTLGYYCDKDQTTYVLQKLSTGGWQTNCIKCAKQLTSQINAHEFITKDSGAREKFDSGAVRDTREGKGRYDLLSARALRRLAGVYERGAKKYSDRNWEAGMPFSRCIDSALRHLFQYLAGERDEDHLAQSAWNLMAVMHFEETKPELNDLPWGQKK